MEVMHAEMYFFMIVLSNWLPLKIITFNKWITVENVALKIVNTQPKCV